MLIERGDNVLKHQGQFFSLFYEVLRLFKTFKIKKKCLVRQKHCPSVPSRREVSARVSLETGRCALQHQETFFLDFLSTPTNTDFIIRKNLQNTIVFHKILKISKNL